MKAIKEKLEINIIPDSLLFFLVRKNSLIFECHL